MFNKHVVFFLDSSTGCQPVGVTGSLPVCLVLQARCDCPNSVRFAHLAFSDHFAAIPYENHVKPGQGQNDLQLAHLEPSTPGQSGRIRVNPAKHVIERS
jgi:hypothetical protein